MAVRKYNHGKFFGPSLSYSGIAFTGIGIFTSFYHPGALALLIPGLFLALTTNGTMLDTGKNKIKSFTRLFGIITVGKWQDISGFTGFTIEKVKSTYTSYSRGNVRLDMNFNDVRLVLVNRKRTKRIIINKYKDFDEARREMDVLNATIFAEVEN